MMQRHIGRYSKPRAIGRAGKTWNPEDTLTSSLAFSEAAGFGDYELRPGLAEVLPKSPTAQEAETPPSAPALPSTSDH